MFFSRSTMPRLFELEQRLPHEMPAGAVALHQRVLDQPRTRREAAEDDVLLEPADDLGLFLLARRREVSVNDSCGFIARPPSPTADSNPRPGARSPRLSCGAVSKGLLSRSAFTKCAIVRLQGTLIFGSEIVNALAGRCARACQRWSVELDGSLVARVSPAGRPAQPDGHGRRSLRRLRTPAPLPVEAGSPRRPRRRGGSLERESCAAVTCSGPSSMRSVSR